MNILKKLLLIIVSIIIALILFINSNCYAATAVVNTDTLKLRQEASTTSTVLELLNQGQKLEIIEENGDWYKVKVSGITGYVNKNYIKVDEQEDNKIEENNTVEESNIVEPQENIEESNTQTPENIEEQTNQVNSEQIDNNQLENKEMTLLKDTNVYILPLINANQIDTLNKDSQITIISKVNNWLYVQTDEVNGWIIQEQSATNNQENTQEPVEQEEQTNNEQTQNTTTAETTEESSETEISRKALYVNSASVYVRKGPGTDYEVVDSLIKNAQVIAVAENGDWYKIEVNGNTGYIAKRLVSTSKQQEDSTSRGSDERQISSNEDLASKQSTTNNASKGEQIASYAKQYLGCKYSYGASGPSTFDCSGFTMYVYKNFGISLSHSAIAQSKNGTYVGKQDLQAGDLVFFKDYPSMEGIGHVGIYIGDGNFVHASSGTGYCVKTSTLLSGSYNTRYETARRLI